MPMIIWKKYIDLLTILNLKRKNDPILGFFKGNHVWQIGPPNYASTFIFLFQVYESIMKLQL
jgi:hypothetical protein